MTPSPSLSDGRRFPGKVREAEDMLRKVLGPGPAEELLAECLRGCGFESPDMINSADRLMRFAWALIAKGGFPELIGRNLKVHAILGGARSDK